MSDSEKHSYYFVSEIYQYEKLEHRSKEKNICIALNCTFRTLGLMILMLIIFLDLVLA